MGGNTEEIQGQLLSVSYNTSSHGMMGLGFAMMGMTSEQWECPVCGKKTPGRSVWDALPRVLPLQAEHPFRLRRRSRSRRNCPNRNPAAGPVNAAASTKTKANSARNAVQDGKITPDLTDFKRKRRTSECFLTKNTTN